MPQETPGDKVKVALDQNFWNDRYKTDQTGWDIGYCSPPLKNYFDQLTNKELKILIPGCGNAYEAEYLHQKGFKQVYLIDLAPEALGKFKKRVPDFPSHHLIQGDFFEMNQTFDRIIEQTFFCAIHPKQRSLYAKKAHDLLKENGKLVGLLFNAELNEEHPPFGGNKEEYLTYFTPYFSIEIMEPSTNSIDPRTDRELFIKLLKK